VGCEGKRRQAKASDGSVREAVWQYGSFPSPVSQLSTRKAKTASPITAYTAYSPITAYACANKDAEICAISCP
jgi:hypothetical protein